MDALTELTSRSGVTVAGLFVLLFLIAAFAWGWYRGLVREILSLTYIVLVFVLVWVLNPHVDTFLGNHTKLYQTVETESRKAVEAVSSQIGLTGTASAENVIGQLQIPDFMKEQLMDSYESQEGNLTAQASQFGNTLSDFLADRICRGISFVVTWILASIVVRLAAVLLESVMKLPLLHEANQLGGGIIGGLKGILLVWLVMLVLTVLCNTDFGKQALNLVERDAILSFLYEHDLLIRMFM